MLGPIISQLYCIFLDEIKSGIYRHLSLNANGEKLSYDKVILPNPKTGRYSRYNLHDGVIPLKNTPKLENFIHLMFLTLVIGLKVHTKSHEIKKHNNTVMDSFYRTIKRELIQGTHYESPKQAQMEILKYIELYYNTKRMHSSLGYLPPSQFKKLNS